jgi:hypothetical protein
MQSNVARVLVGIAAVAAAVILLVVLKDDGDDSPGGDTTAAKIEPVTDGGPAGAGTALPVRAPRRRDGMRGGAGREARTRYRS